MTEKEALAFLGVDDADDAVDAYETLLFDLRRFLISSPVLLKTFESRLKKAEKAWEAFLVFEPGAKRSVLPQAPVFEGSVKLTDHVLNYHTAKNKLRHVLVSVPDFPAVKEVAQQLVELEREYARPFREMTGWTEETVLVSKEPDVMDFLELLREQERQGRSELGMLHKVKENLPVPLQKELKRLSLLTDYLYP